MSLSELDFHIQSTNNVSEDDTQKAHQKEPEERFAAALRGDSYFLNNLKFEETVNPFDNFLTDLIDDEPFILRAPDLSQRKDVLFKSIFRSVKKYYTKLFKKSSDFYGIKSEKDKKAKVKHYIKEFIVQNLLKMENSEGFHEIGVEELCEFMSRIIAPKSCTKSYTTYSCKKYISLLYK